MIQGQLCDEPLVWDEIIHDLGGHPLQLWGWGEVKSAHNWSAHRVVFTDDSDMVVGAAQLLVRHLPGLFRQMVYVPRGPVWATGEERGVVAALSSYVKQHYPGVCLTVEPDAEHFPTLPGWRQSSNTILIPRTLILDLARTEDELLAAMTKKTRQYIRKSSREGLDIKRVKGREELAQCLELYRQTAARAGFELHGDDYYYDVHDKLGDSSLVFAAYHGGSLVAFVWLAASSQTAFELYGGMNQIGQDLRANYALKWHAIVRCKEWGITRYDLNGLLNDGISTFKKGFASHENLLAGTNDYPLSPLYIVWSQGLPIAKKALRAVRSVVSK